VIQFEDFSSDKALNILETYRDDLLCFNDDIQGTGVVAVAAILAAIRRTKLPLQEQHIVIFGAGTAGMGIAHQIYKTLRRLGLSEAEARRRFWLLDRRGLITEHLTVSLESHKPYVRLQADIDGWDIQDPTKISLLEVVRHVKPTILIGTSALADAFSEDIIKEMATHVEHPIIFPLSNPTERSEATPIDLLQWTQGKALIATGSPFEAVDYKNETVIVSQCNNFLAFPGLGLGVLAVKATKVSNNMLWAASEVLSDYTRFQPHTLLPNIHQAIDASRQVAIAVAKAAVREGLTQVTDEAQVEALIDAIRWEPHYLPYQRVT
jgi:malate dehydrogenase (oxaloacetate-decarboxylating)